ncbi:glutathione S-transferase family protein [Montanilutibacter psychrotolerans]|uniref:Glutathione S-transferase family protein n=1 Tax=Montanilutibacter psychrotolerans TaxID=1327343 RepID=A0A3M8SY27_9GAMM|nr:glutathione S-transferase family protein [Lysobacter psychrotolerans]RNF84154.1 glutathione S-transferase family protein [Lysobacter psychrotolerans]
MPTLVIGNKNYSSWSLRPWLLLRVFDIAFDEHRLSLDTPQFHAEVGRWSPTARVPALHDEGLVIWDSLAICEYANERWLDGRGWPASLPARAIARSAAAEMHAGFGALREQLPMNCRRRPDGYRWDAAASADIARVQQLWSQLRQAHGAGGEFLCGSFGIVDAMYAPVAVRLFDYGVPLEAEAANFVDALLELPAMQEWRAAAVAESEYLETTDAIGRASS